MRQEEELLWLLLSYKISVSTSFNQSSANGGSTVLKSKQIYHFKPIYYILITWLGDKEADVVTEDGCVSVQEVGGQFHHDREFRKFFQKLPRGYGTVVAGSTANQH